MTGPIWKIPYTQPDFRLLEKAGISPLLARILASRGLTDPDEVRSLLASGPELLHDPMAMLGMARACERVRKAIVRPGTGYGLRRLRRGRHHGHLPSHRLSEKLRHSMRLVYSGPGRGRLRIERSRAAEAPGRGKQPGDLGGLRHYGRGGSGLCPQHRAGPDHHRSPRVPRRHAAGGLRGHRPQTGRRIPIRIRSWPVSASPSSWPAPAARTRSAC